MAWAEKRGDRWRGQYRDANGGKRTAGLATTKKKALDLANAQELLVHSGEWHDPEAGQVLFSDYFENHWMPNRFLEATTQEGYWSHYRSSLREAFGAMEVRHITRAHVQRWVVSASKSGMSPGTVAAKYTVLKTCLGAAKGVSAVNDGLISKNPCLGVELPKRGLTARKSVYTVSEVDALMAEIPEWWQPIPMMAADTGLRWGELMGLLVGDINGSQVHVRHTVVEVSKERAGNGTRFLDKPWPKSRRARKLAMSSEMTTLIAAMIKSRQLFPADRLFSTPGKDGAVLRTTQWPGGLPVSRSFFRDSVWLPAHEDSGVPRTVEEYDRKFHDLRGSHISWLLAAGVAPTAVMQRAGHSQLSTTMVYVDAMPDADQRALAGLELARQRGRSS